MTDRAPARRGRPKGTGIDDTDLLERVRVALAADPHLRPTAAIRAAGVADPSAIRRLRDKLAASPASAGKAAKASVARAALPLEAGSPAVRSARGRPAAKRRAESADARARTVTETADAQILASYLAAVGGTAVAAHAGGTASPPDGPGGAPAPRVSAAAVAGHAQDTVSASMNEHLPPSSAGAAAILPSPFEMMARMSTPMGATPQTMLEAVRLAVEATAAISRLQVFLMQGSLKGTPLAMMLQGQAAMAQMMLATLAGALARPPAKS